MYSYSYSYSFMGYGLRMGICQSMTTHIHHKYTYVCHIYRDREILCMYVVYIKTFTPINTYKFPHANMFTPTQIHIHKQDTKHTCAYPEVRSTFICQCTCSSSYQIKTVKSKSLLSNLEIPWSCSHFHILLAKSCNTISNIIT